jgi:putative flippase GtrA
MRGGKQSRVIHPDRLGTGRRSGTTVTFFVAVGMNRWMLHLLPASATLGWVVSQATATVINFIMLKWVVFLDKTAEEN